MVSLEYAKQQFTWTDDGLSLQLVSNSCHAEAFGWGSGADESVNSLDDQPIPPLEIWP
jgi:hypothetical protein